jgi:hypothetical protein
LLPSAHRTVAAGHALCPWLADGSTSLGQVASLLGQSLDKPVTATEKLRKLMPLLLKLRLDELVLSGADRSGVEIAHCSAAGSKRWPQ